MPKQPKEKSAHLQELEAVFDRRARRFSPFAVLGLNRPEQEGVNAQAESAAPESGNPPTHPHVGGIALYNPPTHPQRSPPMSKKLPKILIILDQHTLSSQKSGWVGGWVVTICPPNK